MCFISFVFLLNTKFKCKIKNDTSTKHKCILNIYLFVLMLNFKIELKFVLYNLIFFLIYNVHLIALLKLQRFFLD